MMKFFETKETIKLSNVTFVKKVVEETDDVMSKFLGMMMEMSGTALCELDPDAVSMYNAGISFWNSQKEAYIEYAEFLDRKDEEQKESIEELLKLLREMDKKIDRLDKKS